VVIELWAVEAFVLRLLLLLVLYKQLLCAILFLNLFVWYNALLRGWCVAYVGEASVMIFIVLIVVNTVDSCYLYCLEDSIL
jgi:hypothetical protein